MLHTNDNPRPYQGPSYQQIKSRLQYPYLQRPHNPVTGSADCNFHQKFILVEHKEGGQRGVEVALFWGLLVFTLINLGRIVIMISTRQLKIQQPKM